MNTRSNTLWCFVLACVFATFLSTARAGDTVKVTITVTVPKDTDEKATLYIAGSLKEVGEWKADGAKLTRNDDGTYKFEADLPKDQTLEYKITGGSWETVEKNDKGEEIENRTLVLDSDHEEKITVKAWAHKPAAGSGDDEKKTSIPERQSSITGDVRTHAHFASKVLGNERTILVWLPPEYQTNPHTRYPVLYLHDGQNVFDASTSFAGEWRADETADELIRSGKIQPIIMVAIANSGAARIDEYTPSRDEARSRGGKGELYSKFLIDEVKPFIDSHYRTQTDREHTAVAGSSLGGLISLYLGYRHGDVFGMCGVISPSLWWDNASLLKEIQIDPQELKREKIWVDIGTAEGPAEEASQGVSYVQTLTKTLAGAGMVRDKDFVSRTIEGAQHNETAWASRFGDVLKFFFPN
jgi:predicted alpha/beta superfamily hydrolase